MFDRHIADIKHALDNDEFVFYYQAKVSLLSGKINGAEALIRWLKPDGHIIQPNDFIPDAESTGLIKRISLKMFPLLIKDMVIIQDVCPDIVISFNLTAQDLESDEIIDCIDSALGKYRIKPELIQLEITETSLINSSNDARKRVQSLVDKGLALSMDDFGSGYSSMELLSQWPFSVVKIDKGMINRMLSSSKCTTIVQSCIQMAHQLEIEVVAEGIENADVYNYLLNAGCSVAQGFWLSHPLPLSQFLSLIQHDQRWSGMPIGLIHMAQLDHIQWRRSLIDKVMALVFSDHKVNTVQIHEAELNHRDCKLGQWYYGLGKEFSGFPAFDALERPHKQLHELGKSIITSIKENASQEEITRLLRLLTSKSGEVLTLLQELESEAMLDSNKTNSSKYRLTRSS